MLLCVLLAAAPLEVRPPPPELVRALRLSPFYEKSTQALGLPIVSSARVSDAGLREAAFLVSQLLSKRPELGARIASAGIRLAVMAPTELTTDIPEHADLTPKAYWDRRARGLGATVARPAISCAEENLLSFPGDPYATESICVHELGHVIAQFGLAGDPGFTERLERTYQQAHAEGLWKGTYADTNVDEYWAEALQSYFDTNRLNDDQHGPIGTREQLERADPRVARLIRDALGEVSWRYRRVAQRTASQRAQLGPLPDPLPTFAWPARLERQVRPRPAPRGLALEPLVGEPAASPRSEEAAAFTLSNRTDAPVESWWVDFQGALKLYVKLEPGQSMRQPTYVGHRWVIRGKVRVLGQFSAPAGEAELSVRKQ